LERLSGDSLMDGGAQPRRVRTILGQATRQRSNEIPIGVATKHLEPGEATFAETGPIIPDRALLRAAHNGS
jgi:hypothetical protein